MFLHIKEEEVSSMLLICFMPCSLCYDVKNNIKINITKLYVQLMLRNMYYQLLIINFVKVLPDIMHC